MKLEAQTPDGPHSEGVVRTHRRLCGGGGRLLQGVGGGLVAAGQVRGGGGRQDGYRGGDRGGGVGRGRRGGGGRVGHGAALDLHTVSVGDLRKLLAQRGFHFLPRESRKTRKKTVRVEKTVENDILTVSFNDVLGRMLQIVLTIL